MRKILLRVRNHINYKDDKSPKTGDVGKSSSTALTAKQPPVPDSSFHGRITIVKVENALDGKDSNGRGHYAEVAVVNPVREQGEGKSGSQDQGVYVIQSKDKNTPESVVKLTNTEGANIGSLPPDWREVSLHAPHKHADTTVSAPISMTSEQAPEENSHRMRPSATTTKSAAVGASYIEDNIVTNTPVQTKSAAAQHSTVMQVDAFSGHNSRQISPISQGKSSLEYGVPIQAQADDHWVHLPAMLENDANAEAEERIAPPDHRDSRVLENMISPTQNIDSSRDQFLVRLNRALDATELSYDDKMLILQKINREKFDPAVSLVEETRVKRLVRKFYGASPASPPMRDAATLLHTGAGTPQFSAAPEQTTTIAFVDPSTTIASSPLVTSRSSKLIATSPISSGSVLSGPAPLHTIGVPLSHAGEVGKLTSAYPSNSPPVFQSAVGTAVVSPSVSQADVTSHLASFPLATESVTQGAISSSPELSIFAHDPTPSVEQSLRWIPVETVSVRRASSVGDGKAPRLMTPASDAPAFVDSRERRPSNLGAAGSGIHAAVAGDSIERDTDKDDAPHVPVVSPAKFATVPSAVPLPAVTTRTQVIFCTA